MSLKSKKLSDRFRKLKRSSKTEPKGLWERSLCDTGLLDGWRDFLNGKKLTIHLPAPEAPRHSWGGNASTTTKINVVGDEIEKSSIQGNLAYRFKAAKLIYGKKMNFDVEPILKDESFLIRKKTNQTCNFMRNRLMEYNKDPAHLDDMGLLLYYKHNNYIRCWIKKNPKKICGTIATGRIDSRTTSSQGPYFDCHNKKGKKLSRVDVSQKRKPSETDDLTTMKESKKSRLSAKSCLPRMLSFNPGDEFHASFAKPSSSTDSFTSTVSKTSDALSENSGVLRKDRSKSASNVETTPYGRVTQKMTSHSSKESVLNDGSASGGLLSPPTRSSSKKKKSTLRIPVLPIDDVLLRDPRKKKELVYPSVVELKKLDNIRLLKNWISDESRIKKNHSKNHRVDSSMIKKWINKKFYLLGKENAFKSPPLAPPFSRNSQVPTYGYYNETKELGAPSSFGRRSSDPRSFQSFPTLSSSAARRGGRSETPKKYPDIWIPRKYV